MRTTKKILSMILATLLVLGLLPATTFATGSGEDVIYLSISFDTGYIDDKNGNPIAYVPVPCPKSKPLTWLNTAWTICSLTQTAMENMRPLRCSC